MGDLDSHPEALVPAFKLERVLNQGILSPPTTSPAAAINTLADQAGRRTVMYGQINSEPAILILERAPFPTSQAYLSQTPTSLRSLKNLGANDIYFWYLAASGTPPKSSPSDATAEEEFADLKINLIYPCTETHVKKYSKQGVRMVVETPEVYAKEIRPYECCASARRGA